MAKLALLVSLIALVVALLAYREAGGVKTMGDTMRTLQGAVEVARQETADALARVERALRPADGATAPPPKPKPKP